MPNWQSYLKKTNKTYVIIRIPRESPVTLSFVFPQTPREQMIQETMLKVWIKMTASLSVVFDSFLKVIKYQIFEAIYKKGSCKQTSPLINK